MSHTGELVAALHALLNDDYSANPKLRRGFFDRSIVQYPTLAEIALTYGCQNACSFCYAASPTSRPRPSRRRSSSAP